MLGEWLLAKKSLFLYIFLLWFFVVLWDIHRTLGLLSAQQSKGTYETETGDELKYKHSNFDSIFLYLKLLCLY